MNRLVSDVLKEVFREVARDRDVSKESSIGIEALWRCRATCRRWSALVNEQFYGELLVSVEPFVSRADFPEKSNQWLCLANARRGGRVGRLVGNDCSWPENTGWGPKMYWGELERGKPDGYGKCAAAGNYTSLTYVGQWKGGLPHGHGTERTFRASTIIYEVANGAELPLVSSYVGEWRAGRRCGRGLEKIYEHDGQQSSTYEGCWQDSVYHGKGIYKKFHKKGEVRLTWTGSFVRGFLCGEGNIDYASGDRFEGEFLPAQLVFGTYRWKDGRRYAGEIRNNAAEGRGCHVFPDGARYVGTWRDMKRHGSGTMEWADGTTWHGTWHDDIPIGGPTDKPWDRFFLLTAEQMRERVAQLTAEQMTAEQMRARACRADESTGS